MYSDEHYMELITGCHKKSTRQLEVINYNVKSCLFCILNYIIKIQLNNYFLAEFSLNLFIYLSLWHSAA